MKPLIYAEPFDCLFPHIRVDKQHLEINANANDNEVRLRFVPRLIKSHNKLWLRIVRQAQDKEMVQRGTTKVIKEENKM